MSTEIEKRTRTFVVLIKQVPDVNAVKIDRLSGQPVLSGQSVISSYDSHAIEAGLRLRDEQGGGEVIVVSAGPASAKDAITRALAMGADRGIQITLPDAAIDSLATARLLAEAVRGLDFDLILAGQAADDNETGQVGPQVAELLDLPLISSVIELEVTGDRLMATRDTEDGHQTIESELPAVLLTSSGLNEPRYPSLKGIMAAKKKPVEQIAATTDGTERMHWSAPYVPERTISGTVVQDVPATEAATQLVAWLREQKIIA